MSILRRHRRATGNPNFGADSERTVQRGRFVCPREGVERPWRVVALHRAKPVNNPFSFVSTVRREIAYGSILVCDGCGHRFAVEAGRPMADPERAQLFRSGLAMALAGLSRDHVDEPTARAAEIARVSAEAGLDSLPTFDAAGFEALARRLDAHLLPDQRHELIMAACDVARSGRAKPYASSVLQTLGSALGYSLEEITSRLTA